MTDEDRLLFHQAESGPVMGRLEKWMKGQIEEKKVEPKGGRGKAIGYTLKHWRKLTLFLRVAGAPLDNNIVESSLTKLILLRKNPLFYKTENGARVGDVYMSLIHIAELHGANVFEYLAALMRHADTVAKTPGDWMSWNYATTLGERGVGLCSLRELIDTTTPAAKRTFHVFAALAEFEADMVRERTRAGLLAARRRGKKPGRPRSLSPEQVEMARTLIANPNLSARQVAEQLGVHRSTLYRSLGVPR